MTSKTDGFSVAGGSLTDLNRGYMNRPTRSQPMVTAIVMIGTLGLDGWAVIFDAVKRDLGRCMQLALHCTLIMVQCVKLPTLH